jgi:transcriptional regulator with XRE-family HTH domain
MKDYGYTVDSLAKASGLSKSMIGELRTGRKNFPQPESLKKLSKAFEDLPVISFFLSGNLVESFFPKGTDLEIIDFVLAAENLPYLKKALFAKKNNISPEELHFYIDTEIRRRDLS